MHIIFLTTGGTIDKDYPHTTNGWAFEFGDETAIERLLSQRFINPSVTYDIISVCKKDSLEITNDDRDQIWNCIYQNTMTQQRRTRQSSKSSSSNDNNSTTTDDDAVDAVVGFVITHGTDTLIETAQYLSTKINNNTLQQQQDQELLLQQLQSKPMPSIISSTSSKPTWVLPTPINIVMTGAMRPERFTNSDAPMNVGMAIGAVQMLMLAMTQQEEKQQHPLLERRSSTSSNDVYVAMSGVVKSCWKIQRNLQTGQFY